MEVRDERVNRDERVGQIRVPERDVVASAGPLGVAAPSKVVVGVDGSAASVTALRWAAAEARRRGARLSVVVAYRHDMTLLPPLGSDPWHAASGALDRALRAAGLDSDRVDTHLVEGSPAASLVAATRGADLLVLGHHTHASLSRTLLGAVNTDRDGYAQCPVVVVPEGRSEGS